MDQFGNFPPVNLAKPQIIVPETNFPPANLLIISSLPQIFRALFLVVSNASCDTTTRAIVTTVSVNNGNTFEGSGYYTVLRDTAGNNVAVTDRLISAATTQANGATDSFVAQITGYQGGGCVRCDTVGAQSGIGNYIASSAFVGSQYAVNALRIIWNSTGVFDQGTYKLLGVL